MRDSAARALDRRREVPFGLAGWYAIRASEQNRDGQHEVDPDRETAGAVF
jgi:hypothetical protein